MKHLALAVAAVALTGRVAAAQPTDSNESADKSPTTALALSIGGTAASISMFVAAGIDHRDTSGLVGGLILGGIGTMTITPALGHIYGEGRWFTGGTKLRLLGAAAGLVGFGVLVRESNFDNHVNALGDVGGVACLAGIGAFLTGTVYDIATAGSATERENDGFTVTFAPAVIRTTSNTTVAGLGLGGTF